MPTVTAELHSHKNVSDFLESCRKPLRNDFKFDILFQSPLVGCDWCRAHEWSFLYSWWGGCPTTLCFATPTFVVFSGFLVKNGGVSSQPCKTVAFVDISAFRFIQILAFMPWHN